MITFREKDFTIQEGHYTGPKDQDKVPGAVEVISKSAIGGALAGSAIGAILKDTTALEGAITGGKYGAIGGVLLKFFLNYLHNPMTRVKYQDIDKNIRREFGIIRLSGITVGDTVSKRASIDEKFSFNDRAVTEYKINFSVQNDQVTMYTLGITDEELKKIDKILDYYCKKYTGMSYVASRINEKINAYSVIIVFTNYQVISNFIMELSNELETKINLLDNKALVQNRINGEDGERNFSVTEINKFDAIKILGTTGISFLKEIPNGFGKAVSSVVIGLVSSAAKKIGKDEISKTKIPAPRQYFGNPYLEGTLKKLHYVEGFHYSIGKEDSEYNMSLVNGLFIVTAKKEDSKEIDEIYWKHLKNKIRRSDTGKVIVWTYSIQSRDEFEFALKKLMKTELKFNIYE